MKKEVKFDEWLKFDLRIGEVVRVDKDHIEISCCNRNFNVNMNLDVNIGDKIVVGLMGEEIVIPVVNDKIPISPEKDIEVGSRIR